LCKACGVACKLSRPALVALVLTFVGWVNVAKSKFGTWLHDELLTKIHDALPFFTSVFATHQSELVDSQFPGSNA
jgi:hypothetical protein